METSKLLFMLLVVALAVLSEAKPTRLKRHDGNQLIHCSKVRGVRKCKMDGECACLNHHNTTLICNFEGRCDRPGPIDEIMRIQPCSNVRGVRKCNVDGECACLNHHNTTLICNFESRCDRPGPIDEIMRRQPCPEVFKSNCSVNADCPCREHRLICEDRECVKARPRRKKAA